MVSNLLLALTCMFSLSGAVVCSNELVRSCEPQEFASADNNTAYYYQYFTREESSNDYYENLVVPYSNTLFLEYTFNSNGITGMRLGVSAFSYKFSNSTYTTTFAVSPYEYLNDYEASNVYYVFSSDYYTASYIRVFNPQFSLIYTSDLELTYHFVFDMEVMDATNDFLGRINNVDLSIYGAFNSNGVSNTFENIGSNPLNKLQTIDTQALTPFSSGYFDLNFTFNYSNLSTLLGNSYTQGYNEGRQVGYNQGLNDGADMDINFLGLFGAIADTPVYIIRSLFSFDIFGTTALTIFMSLLTVIIVVHFVRKFI